METDNAHLLCLDARSGAYLDVPYAPHKNYGATSAPLIVKDKVLVGTAVATMGARLSCRVRCGIGEEKWRFGRSRTGEKGNEVGLRHLFAWRRTAWMPGTYDPELNTCIGHGILPRLRWQRSPGDDLYTSCCWRWTG